jgi:hypothetical protein
VERLAIGLGLGGLAVCVGLFGWPSATLLTVGAVVAIVGFRGLTEIVSGLTPEGDGKPPRGVIILHLLRLLLLMGAIGLAVALGSGFIVFLVVGVSTVPLALMVAAGRELFRPHQEEGKHG